MDEQRQACATHSKAEIQRTYSRLSRFYDAWSILAESKAANRALKLGNIRNGEDILEVATGTGRFLERIVSMNCNGRNAAMDLSPQMIALARTRLTGVGSARSLQIADACSMPYAAGSFDLIVCSYMFDLLPREDFPVVLAEFKRVLRPGGRTVVTTWTPARKWYSRIWDRLASAFPRAMAGCRPVSPAPAVSEAGFSSIHEEYVSQMTFPSVVIRAEKP